jgi:hypothetical protein
MFQRYPMNHLNLNYLMNHLNLMFPNYHFQQMQ